MLRIDQGSIEMQGNANRLMSEISHMLWNATKSIAKQVGEDHKEIFDKAIEGARVYQLTEAGMDVNEAMKVIGLEGMAVVQEPEDHYSLKKEKKKDED